MILGDQSSEPWNKLPRSFKQVVDLHKQEQINHLNQLMNLKVDNTRLRKAVNKQREREDVYNNKTKVIKR